VDALLDVQRRAQSRGCNLDSYTLFLVCMEPKLVFIRISAAALSFINPAVDGNRKRYELGLGDRITRLLLKQCSLRTKSYSERIYGAYASVNMPVRAKS